MQTLKFYAQLLKFRLSITVVFSAMIGYLLGFETFNFSSFIYLLMGGFLVTGSANAFNQILEKDKDKLMERTSVRPLPMGNLSVFSATVFAVVIGCIGLVLLNNINPQGSFYGFMSKSSFFGLISILLYVLSYTPLKRVSTISIFIGAIPGAIPFLLGYVAATDDFGLAAGTLFAIQFFWQFPHFIAIAWVLDKEYKEAGFKMLFGGEKNKYPAVISIITSSLMTVVSVIPFFYISDLNLSVYSLFVVLVLGIWFTYKSVKLYQSTDDISARKLMTTSFAYLPLMQIVYVIDRFLF
jgi:protoheme IX farnesyltransferase